MYLRQLLLRIRNWFLLDDPWYDWDDQKIDGYTDLDFDMWYLQRGKDK